MFVVGGLLSCDPHKDEIISSQDQERLIKWRFTQISYHLLILDRMLRFNIEVSHFAIWINYVANNQEDSSCFSVAQMLLEGNGK